MKKQINGIYHEAVATESKKKDADFIAKQYRDRGWLSKVTRVKTASGASYVVWVQETKANDDYKVAGYKKKRKKDYELSDKGKTEKLFKDKEEEKEERVIHSPSRFSTGAKAVYKHLRTPVYKKGPSKFGKAIKKSTGKAWKHLRTPVNTKAEARKNAKKFGKLLFGKNKKWVGRF